MEVPYQISKSLCRNYPVRGRLEKYNNKFTFKTITVYLNMLIPIMIYLSSNYLIFWALSTLVIRNYFRNKRNENIENH